METPSENEQTTEDQNKKVGDDASATLPVSDLDVPPHPPEQTAEEIAAEEAEKDAQARADSQPDAADDAVAGDAEVVSDEEQGDEPPDPSPDDLAGDAMATKAQDTELDARLDALHDRAEKAIEEPGAAPYDLAGDLSEDREVIPSQKILIQNLTPVPQASIVLTSHDRIKRIARMAASTTCEFELNEGERLYIVACPDEEHQEIQEQATADGCNNSSA